jgi:hypothetical protein
MSPDELLYLPVDEKIRRFDAMCAATFSHVDGRDLLAELHPRKELDIKRRVDGHETWYEGDWLSNLMEARNGPRPKVPHSSSGQENAASQAAEMPFRPIDGAAPVAGA